MKRIGATIVSLALCACAAIRPQPVPVALERVPEEIARWEEAARRPDRTAEAQRRLFVLYSLPTRAGADYARSAKALATYVALDPAASKDPEVRRWQSVLSALSEARTEARREEEESAALKAEVRELQKGLVETRRENQELKETLEKLKELDLQMDRQRRGALPP